MKSYKIRFSHDYPKLWGQTMATLIYVSPLSVQGGLNPALKEYDTKTTTGDYYPIADGEYIQLIFIGDKGIPFSTIRKRYGYVRGEGKVDKLEYYISKLCELFDVVVKEEE